MTRQNTHLVWIVLGLVSFMVFFSSVFIVGQTEQALVLQLRAPVAVYKKPGLKFKLPFIQDVVYYDKRLIDFYATRPREVITTDNKRLIVDSFVRYRITDPLKFFQAVGTEDTMNSRLNAILESSLGQAIGQVSMTELLSPKRGEVMQHIKVLVNEQAHGRAVEGAAEDALVQGGFGIQVVDVRVRRTDLPAQNSEAIYRRMQTERVKEAKTIRATGEEEALKIRARADRDRIGLLASANEQSEIIRGQGDAEATRITGEAFGKDPGFYGFYRKLQAYRNSFTSKDTRMVLSPEKNEFMRGLSNE